MYEGKKVIQYGSSIVSKNLVSYQNGEKRDIPVFGDLEVKTPIETIPPKTIEANRSYYWIEFVWVSIDYFCFICP